MAQVKEWQSKAALEQHAERSEPWSLVLGKDSEAPQSFVSISLQLPANVTFELCVISSGTGFSPSTIFSPDRKLVVVGYDDVVSMVNISLRRELFKRKLDGVFYGFIEASSDHLTVIHELGLIRLDYTGNEIWSFSTDVIETWQVEPDDSVVVKTLDSDQRVVVNLTTGFSSEKK